MAAIIASVVPHVTTRFDSGSAMIPLNDFARRAIASRSSGAPQVIEYWLNPASRARVAASVNSRGGAEPGEPGDELIASWTAGGRVLSRVRDSGTFCTQY